MTEVVYQDKNILAVNKPPGIVVFHEKKNNDECLSLKLSKRFPEIMGVGGERNGAVHRLDKDTSGIILFAKNETTLSFLQKQILEKKVKKEYIALVFKAFKEDKKRICTFIDRSPKDRRKQRAHNDQKGKRKAITFLKTFKRFDNFTLLRVFPVTGRKHQIRCHLSFVGHPVAGDKLYGFKDQIDPPHLKRQFLHARSIEIETSNGKKKFKAKIAPDLKKVLKSLKNKKFN